MTSTASREEITQLTILEGDLVNGVPGNNETYSTNEVEACSETHDSFLPLISAQLDNIIRFHNPIF